MQEMLGDTPRAFAAFATHLHLLVSRSPIVHQRMFLPQVRISSMSISLPVLKYVPIVVCPEIISKALLSSCIILFKTIFQDSVCGFSNHSDNLGLRESTISLEKEYYNQNISKRIISKRDLDNIIITIFRI